MNKTKIILSVTGGVAALAVVALGVLTWLSFAARTEALEGGEESAGLGSAVASVEKLMAKKPYPNAANAKRLEANALTLTDWCAEARKNASRGDWVADDLTPAQFKEQIVKDAKALAAASTQQLTRVVAPDFGFGPFKDYLADKMPAADQLKRLQRQWFDVTSLIVLLETNGVDRLTDVQIVDRNAKGAANETAAKGKDAKKAKKKAASNKKKVVAEGEKEPSVETYRLAFTASPSAFARVMEQLSFQDRFTVVDDFAFARERDAIALALGGGVEKKEGASAPAGGRRGRRGRGAAQEAKKAEGEGTEGVNPVIFDPKTDSAFRVDLTVSVYDFRSLEEDEKEKGEVK